MEIPNLVQPHSINSNNNLKLNKIVLISLIIFGVVSGFWLIRVTPQKDNQNTSFSLTSNNKKINSTDSISSTEQLEVGKLYGNNDPKFKDKATGTIEKGSINGEGTHILNREGGKNQRASLTSSAVDLDLFVNRKVEVNGETNSSTKTSWLLDVGNIKILE